MNRSCSISADLLSKGSKLSWEIEINDTFPADDLEGLISHFMDDAELLIKSEVLPTLSDHSEVPFISDRTLNRTERRERTVDGVFTAVRFTVEGFRGVPPTIASTIVDGFFESVFSHLDSHTGDSAHTFVMEVVSLGALVGNLSDLEKFLDGFADDQKK